MRWSAVGARVSLGAVLISLLLVPTVLAADIKGSNVYVMLCGDAVGASVSIATPVGDSVVSQPTLVLSGSVADASQIDVKVDGVYSSTIPLSMNQTTYSAPITLGSGTHTILLTANDICGIQDATAQIVVTYTSNTTPTTGEDIPTASTNEDGFGGGEISISSKSGLSTGGVVIQQVTPLKGRDSLLASGIVLNDGLNQEEISVTAAVVTGTGGLFYGLLHAFRHFAEIHK